MNAQTTTDSLRVLGLELGQFLKRSSDQQPATAALQAVIADLAVDHDDLVAPLKDLVSRPSFRLLTSHALSGSGSIQRDALVEEISRVYHPAVCIAIEEVLNGFLELSGGIASQITESVLAEHQSPAAKSDSRQSTPDTISPSLNSSHNESSKCLSPSNVAHSMSATSGSANSYFDTALQIARKQGTCDLRSACAKNSGRSVIHYVLRDKEGHVLERIPLAMVDASLRSNRVSIPSSQLVSRLIEPNAASEQMFHYAVEIARRLGNKNLDTASASTSRVGIINYSIRDSSNTILAKVPLSMLRNHMQ